MKVLVIGAGACGLMAARELSRAGHEVVVLEARDRIGGRIYPLSVEEFGYEAMGGAEFVHGEAPITCALVAEAGLTLTHATEWWNVEDGEPSVDSHFTRHPLLEEKLAQITEDTDVTVEQFLQTYFTADEYTELRDFVQRWIEGYDAGDISRASALSLHYDMAGSARWKQRNLREGYGALMRYLESQLGATKIRLSEPVTHVVLTDSGVQVKTSAAEYSADKVIVTVPISVIKTIQFEPTIPEKFEAADSIGMGSVIKILLRFDHKWWGSIRESKFENFFFMFSHEVVSTWWTQYPEIHPTLTGWVAGPKAHLLRNKTDIELQSLALQSLAKIFTVDIAHLKSMLIACRVINWENDPYARGAYSYTTPEQWSVNDELCAPVQGKIYFAGEVFGDDQQATVEGAFQSGVEVADRINKI